VSTREPSAAGTTKPLPRDFMEVPASFGRRPDARWVVDAATPRRLLAAAWLQHQAALVVNYEVMRQRGGLSALARTLGQHPDYLRRKLTGGRWASLRDLGDWLVEFGPEILPRLLSSDQIFPPPELVIDPEGHRTGR
jgi:hypothetical protein